MKRSIKISTAIHSCNVV